LDFTGDEILVRQ